MKSSFTVPCGISQGFGAIAVGAPFAVVPPNSTLTYDVELLRLSNVGPDALTQVTIYASLLWLHLARGKGSCSTGANSKVCIALNN